MKGMAISRRELIGAASVMMLVPSSTRAQTLSLARIICGFPAGGTADSTARRVAELWRGKLAASVIVENRVGAAGRIAVSAVKDAPADGSMVLLSPESMFTIHSSVYRKLGYDPDKDITPVSPIASFTFALGIGPGVPNTVKTLADFVQWAKANGAKISFGSPAAGSMPHFLGDLFFRAIGSGARHAPYRGSAPALQDLVGGHVPAVMTVLGDFLPFKASPGMRILAVTDKARSHFLPDVPTFAELGFPAVSGVETYGIFLPGKSPAALVARVHQLIGEAVAQKDMIASLAQIGMDPASLSASEYRAYLARERTRWAPVVKQSGFSLDE
jgi:tripartite-type tricarboxylate transporter receptor subunit TctC